MKPLLYAHIGDLHMTTVKEQNFHDLCSIAAQIENNCPSLDFVFLPGDNADHGNPESYRLIRTVLKMLSAPVKIITGDHDMEQGGLDHFLKYLSVAGLPNSLIFRNHLCCFLDCCGAGAGGPDFRLGTKQLDWLENQLKAAKENRSIPSLFMHVYPDDLAEEKEQERLLHLFKTYHVGLVAMGHTHFNEITNDGTTVFAAVRSTGQIEEGPAGFALVSRDGENISWRFKQIDDPYPFVLITQPTDFRLTPDPVTDSAAPAPRPIRAVVFGEHPVSTVCFQVDHGPWQPMNFQPVDECWQSETAHHFSVHTIITVRATDVRGRPGFHRICPAWSEYVAPLRIRDGSDADRIDYWPDNGIPGSQLGPNRNTRPNPEPKKI